MSGSSLDAAGELHAYVSLKVYMYAGTTLTCTRTCTLGLLGLRYADDTRDNDNDEIRTHTTALRGHIRTAFYCGTSITMITAKRMVAWAVKHALTDNNTHEWTC